MKRGTPDHPKTLRLMGELACPKYAAVGLLEMLWHFTAKFAPQGDVGRWPDDAIAAGVSWDGEPAKLVRALINCRWVDAHAKHRLLVHDWQDHADEAVRKFLVRAEKPFLTSTASGRTASKLVPTIYVLRAGDAGRIKIGHTETTVEARLAALQTGSAEQLKILCRFPGTRRDELDLHKRFAAHHITGEWFDAHGDILSFVDQQLKVRVDGRRRRTTAAANQTAADDGSPPLPLPLPLPEPYQSQEQQPSSAVADMSPPARVFAHWQFVMAHPEAKATAKRMRLVTARLRDGYTVEQLCTAIDGCRASEFHRGGNKDRTVFDDLSLICRDGEHVEMFVGKASNATEGNGRPMLSPISEHNLRALGMMPEGWK